jgi:hypothetical protein
VRSRPQDLKLCVCPVKVLGFVLAKVMSGRSVDGSLTHEGEILGAPDSGHCTPGGTKNAGREIQPPDDEVSCPKSFAPSDYSGRTSW